MVLFRYVISSLLESTHSYPTSSVAYNICNLPNSSLSQPCLCEAICLKYQSLACNFSSLSLKVLCTVFSAKEISICAWQPNFSLESFEQKTKSINSWIQLMNNKWSGQQQHIPAPSWASEQALPRCTLKLWRGEGQMLLSQKSPGANT